MLAQTSEESSPFTQDTGVKYLSPLPADLSTDISLALIYGTWREDAVPAEPHGTVMALPCTARTDFHSVLLLIYGKGQSGVSMLQKKKKDDKNLVWESEL